mgnify:CR=1 FL=1
MGIDQMDSTVEANRCVLRIDITERSEVKRTVTLKANWCVVRADTTERSARTYQTSERTSQNGEQTSQNSVSLSATDRGVKKELKKIGIIWTN